MLFFALCAALTLTGIGFLLLPLLRQAPVGEAAGREAALYRDQLDEIQRDMGRGVIEAEEADAARGEIERRLLSALRRAAREEERVDRKGRLLFLGLIGLVPLLAVLLYAELGTPNAAREPAPLITGPAASSLPAEITALEERLANAPEDPTGQLTLARAYAVNGRFEDALLRYEAAARLLPQPSLILPEIGEVLVRRDAGRVGPEATELFILAAEALPNDPRPPYYLALRTYQQGDVSAGLTALRALAERLPPTGQYGLTVRETIRSIESREAEAALLDQ